MAGQGTTTDVAPAGTGRREYSKSEGAGRRRIGPGLRTFLIFVALVALGALIFPSSYFYRVGTLVWINTLAVTGIVVLLGYVGLVSLGHAGFFAIGAYVTAIGPNYGIPSPLAMAGGVALAGLLALIVGRPILKLSGYYLAIATLGLGMLIWMVLSKEAWLTGGPDGMVVSGMNARNLFKMVGLSLKSAEAWYWVAGLVAAIGAAIAVNLAGSPSGRALRAIHDSDVAARSLGVDVAKAKSRAFVISAIYAAVAGALLALANGYITPDTGGFMHSVEMVTMAVLGGAASVYGALVGALILTALPQVLTVFADYEHMVLGGIMVLTMILMRRGLVPFIADLWNRRKS
ncbi:branched-chain amino acid ABC transporter permease [Limimaricola pyoseonensis]|uniref:Amino acid/amide ABC transporter membrane protein 2, HAAT family n=1 Tax=Limimaricola pyoseonensis TaxID=521013 RepID=A0A1G7H594_9RHOB|nr:branched-chain amino acid ABC transporter permease [Limimaricola pyoseonensis]SDE95531.1 amino acid/amide ABC transporter membrane protein 2, HAAT family [Limimaricola pyoseonensis]